MELKVAVVARALSGTIDHSAPTKLYSHQRRGTLSERPGKSPWNFQRSADVLHEIPRAIVG